MTDDSNIVAFPRAGFVIGEHHCRRAGDERHLICLLNRGHDGDHLFTPWEGCRVRVPFGKGTVPFHGFANG